MIDILIANNNEIAGEGLKTIIQSKMGNRVLGIANSIDHLTQQSSKYFPDIVVIDYSSDVFGVKAIKKIKSIYKDCKILAITDKLPKATVYNALKSGVDSYLLSDCEKPEIMDALADTYVGKQFYCGEVIDILAEGDDAEKQGCSGISLSEREIEVIKLISDGFSNKEIAEKIFLSTHTVNTHRKNIMNKLGIKNTAGIVIYAFRENIIH
ncbi:response regulator transcription factor [Vicingaceae bacterium]|jgi:DNA-binding NarL/FixJ family response regulator|nr:response regulator transcription factor [Vicingaceae bacterium]